jgi:hypothetical protein
MVRREVTERELVRGEMTRTEVTRAEVTEREVVRGEVTRRDVTRSEVSRTQLARGEVSRSQVSRGEVSRREVTRATGGSGQPPAKWRRGPRRREPALDGSVPFSDELFFDARPSDRPPVVASAAGRLRLPELLFRRAVRPRAPPSVVLQGDPHPIPVRSEIGPTRIRWRKPITTETPIIDLSHFARARPRDLHIVDYVSSLDLPACDKWYGALPPAPAPRPVPYAVEMRHPLMFRSAGPDFECPPLELPDSW